MSKWDGTLASRCPTPARRDDAPGHAKWIETRNLERYWHESGSSSWLASWSTILNAAAIFTTRRSRDLGETCYEIGFSLLESLGDMLEQGGVPQHGERNPGPDCSSPAATFSREGNIYYGSSKSTLLGAKRPGAGRRVRSEYRVVLGKEIHFVEKDKTCSYGRDCIAIGAVKQYLRTGGSGILRLRSASSSTKQKSPLSTRRLLYKTARQFNDQICYVRPLANGSPKAREVPSPR